MREIAKTRPAGAVLYWIVRLYCATLRLKIENEDEWFSYLEQGARRKSPYLRLASTVFYRCSIF